MDIMKKFRGKEVIGWRGLEASTLNELMQKTNKLMEEFDFIDTQYSSHTYRNASSYSVIVLLAEKED
ncbi:unnamed protein product [marine sediment metagenome]|uniref:Uncharacterized protein n=1 Tax=marine sediment metagenome TaxID=412755 RepID=X1H8C0_9ZZZZ